ncbi:rod shape-determining protein RodA [Spongiibacter sp. IMCC21906]|uniref:rod shape-determining protein RodA n=1 Tax=Spongiibacter sp. IMCC21906 TaxID=1620392 RepID=UPI00062DDAF7|nr:rod shape-determining protein RodA [Spongiibacter sp. IMCC21906]AKH70843.1 rod shape-determining protein RodA [Spongiibacter sp. IMCC21906]
MSNSDFLRQLPGDGHSMHGQRSISRRLRIDMPLLILLLILAGVGLTVLYSASDQNMASVLRQGRFLSVAFVVMILVAQIRPEQLKRWAPFAYIVCLFLLVGVEFLGADAKGAQRWLNIVGFRFQPSELAKLVIPMALAWYLASHPLPPAAKHSAGSLVLIMLPTVLVAIQPDLGTSILVATSGVFVLFLAGISWTFIFSGLTLVALSIYPMWHFVMHGYQRQRVLTLLNPESDKLGAGWNIIQSKTAIGSGGFDGKSWLHGTQSHLDFLPESHTDFIIAVLAEEFGLRGVLLLLLLYGLIISRGIWIATQATQCFGRLLGGSIILTFFVYVFVNMGMVSGLLPVVGVPLPLVSQGGTSLITLLVGFGILMGIRADERLVHQ